MNKQKGAMVFQKKRINLADVGKLKKTLRNAQVHTVCESAKCPNIGECFCQRTATFLIAGTICTRGCRFCAVTPGKPAPLDSREPQRIADAVVTMGLSYVVVTSVTRDDISDGGARHFVETIASIKARVPASKVEVLVPDFKGDHTACTSVCNALPDVFAHNLETVPRLYSAVRPGAGYQQSLNVLRWAKEAGMVTKSGVMVGLGETVEEVNNVMDDLRLVKCDILTIGQYLAPGRKHFPVHEYIAPGVFEQYKDTALRKGFTHCASAPYVRSSYLAETMTRCS
jgi:lipoic acid synthetase